MVLKSFVFLIAVLFCLVHANAIELSPELEKQAQEIFYQNLSPFCPGRLISDCPSTSALELKDKIKAKLLAGESTEQIEQYLVDLYGPKIRATPAFEGIGLLAWWGMPAFVLLGFAALMLWYIKNRVSVRDTQIIGGSSRENMTISPDQRVRIERELE